MNEMQTVHIRIQKEPSQDYGLQQKCKKHLRKVTRSSESECYIYDVWHFKHSSTDLWKGYVRKFLKIKLESSKFTSSEEEYKEKATKFGIELHELKENQGLRHIAKICLNSLWGKFGQNPKVKHSEYIQRKGFL